MKKIFVLLITCLLAGITSANAQSCNSATGFKYGNGFAQWVHCTQDFQIVLGGVYYYTTPYFTMDGDTIFQPQGANMTAWVAFLDSSFQLIRLVNGISLKDAGGSFSQASVFDMFVDNQKNFYFTGRYADDTLVVGVDTVFSDSYAEGYLVRYDSLGNETLLKSFGSRNAGTNFTFDDHGRSIAVDVSGNMYVTGSFKGDKFGINSDSVNNGTNVGLNSYAQAFTFSLNPTGQTRWVRACGTPTQDEEPLGIAVDDQGNVSICGQTSADNQLFTFGTFTHLFRNVQNSYQGFVARYDSQGLEQWLFPLESYYGTGPDITGYDVALDNAGNTYAMGHMDAWGLFNGDTVRTSNYSSVWTTKINAAGVAEFVKLGNNDTFYPFPGHIFYKDGKVVVIGQAYTNQMTFDHLGAEGPANTFVAVYDTLGTIQWVRSGISNLTNGGDIYFYGVAVDPLGRVHVSGGASGGNVTVVPYVYNAPAGGSFVLFRFDSIANNGFVMNLTVNGSDTVVCGLSRQIQGVSTPAGAGVRYTWWADNDTISLPNFVGPNINASPKFTTTYIASANYNGCVVVDTVVLYSIPLPLNAGTDTSLCFGDTLRFDATFNQGGQYVWTPPSGLSNDSVRNPLLTAVNAATYVCQVSAYGCISVDTVVVQVSQPVTAGFQFVTNQLDVSFSSSSVNGLNYWWDFGDGTIDSTTMNPQHTYLNDSIWNVCLIVSNNCFADTICQVIDLTGTGISTVNSGTISVGDSYEAWYIYQQNGSHLREYTLLDAQGRTLRKGSMDAATTMILKSGLAPGSYQFVFQSEGKRCVKKVILVQ